MIISRSGRLRIAAIGIVALAVGVLTSCSPEPEPTPTPTAAFASEEEAFAAAEEVYRAYNDAGNARRAGKESPDPQDLLIGSALEGDIDAQNYLEREELRLTGVASVLSFTGLESEIGGAETTVTALVCLDASGTRVVDAAGDDVTPSERPEVVAQLVTFLAQPSQFLISVETAETEDRCG